MTSRATDELTAAHQVGPFYLSMGGSILVSVEANVTTAPDGSVSGKTGMSFAADTPRPFANPQLPSAIRKSFDASNFPFQSKLPVLASVFPPRGLTV